MKILKALSCNQKGATAIEYGLIAALVSVVIMTAVQQVGTSTNQTFENANQAMTGASQSE